MRQAEADYVTINEDDRATFNSFEDASEEVKGGPGAIMLTMTEDQPALLARKLFKNRSSLAAFY